MTEEYVNLHLQIIASLLNQMPDSFAKARLVNHIYVEVRTAYTQFRQQQTEQPEPQSENLDQTDDTPS